MFTEARGGALAFHPATGPSDAEVAAALATIRHRVQRLLVRHGLEPADDATGPADRLAEESPVPAGIVGASVQGRVALGSRAGARVWRLGDARDTETVTSRGARQPHLEGFDLHANVWVSANGRAGLDRLCRYVLRPPFAQERLRLRSDGRIVLELIATLHDPAVIRKLLAHLGMAGSGPSPGPAPPESGGVAPRSIRGAVHAVEPSARGVMGADPAGPFAEGRRRYARTASPQSRAGTVRARGSC